MTTISTHEAQTHFRRYIADVTNGERFVITRDKEAIALLVPVKQPRKKPRPKVGDIKGKPFKFETSALVPLSKAELKKWGLWR